MGRESEFPPTGERNDLSKLGPGLPIQRPKNETDSLFYAQKALLFHVKSGIIIMGLFAAETAVFRHKYYTTPTLKSTQISDRMYGGNPDEHSS